MRPHCHTRETRMVTLSRLFALSTSEFPATKDRSTMSDLTSVLRRLATVLMVAALSAGVTAGVAQASTSWGELGHFGAGKGTGTGQFEPGENTAAIGVDQEDNSVYVVDLPDSNGEFRIQKFEDVGGTYTAVASTFFTPVDKEAEEPNEIEGVAVDPKDKRVYVLAAETRPEKKIDPEEYAASQLFAFSTEQSGGKLVPAAGTPQAGEPGEAVLAGTNIFKPIGNKAGESLLEPSGIAFDPHTGDVIVVGEQETSAKQPLVALWAIGESGTVAGRYLDETNFFGTGEDFGGASSPAVSNAGNVYVTGEENESEIDEIPMNAGKTSFEKKSPTHFVEFSGLLEQLTKFPAEPPPEFGGSLAISEEGTIYTTAAIVEQLKGQVFGDAYPGVLAFDSGGVEEGWTGGGSVETSGNGGACQVSILLPSEIAAGKDHTVFVYDPAKYEVQEFGLGGGGCPTATATPPAASVSGVPVSEGEVIPLADEVTFSSTLTQANALSVEWNFGDGTTPVKQEVSQYQTTQVSHVFAKRGLLEVTEKIRSDDLATPEIVEHSKVDIEAGTPTAKTGTASSLGETTATLNGTVDPNGEPVTQCTFEYGPSETDEKSEACSQSPASLGSGTSAQTVSLPISGLSKGATYYFKVVAESTGGKDEGTTVSFKTTGTSGGGGGTGGGSTTTTTGTGGVLPVTVVKPPAIPDATLASNSMSVSSSGAFTLKVSCPTEAGSCAGTVSLKTLKAVVATSLARSAKSKAAILTLASGSFTVTGGQSKTITLHLSASGRALLAHAHLISARATIVAGDPGGASHTTIVTVTLRPAKKPAKHH
jgi:hypothetical protein